MKCERVRSQAESLRSSFLLPRLGLCMGKDYYLKKPVVFLCGVGYWRMTFIDYCQSCEEYLLLIRQMVLLGIRPFRQGDKLGTSSTCPLHTEGGIRDLSSLRERLLETAAA